MRLLFIYIFLSLISLSGIGQNKVDSLNQLISTSEKKDQANIYLELATEYYYKDTKQLEVFSHKADSLAEKYGVDSSRIKALNYLSYGSIQSGNVKDAISYNKQALDLSIEKGLEKQITSSKFYKGYYFYATGQPDSSLVYLNQAYNEAKYQNDSLMQLGCLNTIAANQLNKANYSQALENFTKAYKIADDLKLIEKKKNLDLNIGTTLLYNEEPEKAINYFKKVISNSDPKDATLAYSAALNNMGTSLTKLNRDKEAIKYLDKALIAFKQINNKLQIAQVYTNLGQCHYRLNNYLKASKHLLRAIELNRESQSMNQLIVNLMLLAELHLSQKNYTEAKACLDEAKLLTDKYNINYNESDLYRDYSSYYQTTKQYKKALEYKQKELSLRDSIFKADRQQQIYTLQTKFETQIKENENEALRKDIALNNLEIERQNQIRNFLIVLALLVSILVFVLLNRARTKRKAHLIIEKQKEELEKLNKTKDKFFSIIAHDLKSPFSALLGFSELLATSYDNLEDTERKSFINDLHTASQSTYSLVENLLTWSRIQQGNITISKTKNDIFNLIENGILANQSTAKLKNITILNKLNCHTPVWVDKFSIETVIGNLVSNAIKFTQEEGNIDISMKEEDDQLIIYISDTGVGMTSEQIQDLFRIDNNISTTGTNNETGTGLGLILCKEFIEQNNGEIWVESEVGKGSLFSFSVPIYK
ncbi:MAG: tetratricopeptide repeat protein [Labilibaculum sp.]|nr:tetratricopeptide repeat protein [Labilibaculum sp.]MBI9059900.1 tetratricopeptide repeat protein [Labilibaculum sp.]